MGKQDDNHVKDASPVNGQVPPVEHRFKKGWKGGPGRPKGSSLTNRLKEILEQEAKGGKTVSEALMEAGVKAALKGDYRFWAAILERCDGKIPSPVDVTSDGQSLTFVIKPANKPDDHDGSDGADERDDD